MDPFDTLGLAPLFHLDLVAAEKRYRDLSRKLHPDRYMGRPAGERRMALAKAIEVNEAWRVLRDPVRRAEALLRRAGVAVGESEEREADPALLMDMMEQREALAEARSSSDAARLQELTREMQEREARLLAAMQQNLDGASNDAHAELASRVLPLLVELRYVRKFLEEASLAEDAMV